MNYTGQILHYYSDVFIKDQIIQTSLAVKFGKVAQKINGRYMDPRDLMLSAFAQYKELGSSSFSSEVPPKTAIKAQKAFVFRVQLPCDGMDIWRKIVVPAEITFAKFHRILQACFNWQDAHLHLFQVMAENGNVAAESKFDDPYGVDWELKQFRDYFSERKHLTAYLPDYSMIHFNRQKATEAVATCRTRFWMYPGRAVHVWQSDSWLFFDRVWDPSIRHRCHYKGSKIAARTHGF